MSAHNNNQPHASKEVEALRAELASLRAEVAAQKAYTAGFTAGMTAASSSTSHEQPRPANQPIDINQLLSFKIISGLF